MHEDKLFFETVQEYLQREHDIEVRFSVHRNHFFIPRPKTELEYGWYAPISAMFSLSTPEPTRMLSSMYSGIHSVKAMLQSWVFAIMKSAVVRRAIWPSYVLVEATDADLPKVAKHLGDIVIGGLGSRIKIIDCNEGCVTSIPKRDCDPSLIENELLTRESLSGTVPTPRILSIRRDAGIIIAEEYLEGIPLRSIDGDNWGIVRTAFKAIATYYQSASPTSHSTDEYKSSLLEQIKKGTSSNFNADGLDAALSVVDHLCDTQATPEIQLVRSHGDFWPGNIIVLNEGYAVIDWERSGVYSATHDLFTFLAIYGMEQRDFNLIHGTVSLASENQFVQDVLPLYSDITGHSLDASSLRTQLGIFILERIAYPVAAPAGKLRVEQASDEIAKWTGFAAKLEIAS